jgi:hypothetical protein
MAMRLSLFMIPLLLPLPMFSQTENTTSPCILDTVNNRKVYLLVDKAPETSIEFINLPQYITGNNFWPAVDTSCYFTKVYLSFIVEPDGAVSNTNVETRGGFCVDPVRDLNNKAYMKERLKNSLSKLRWTPGELKGQKVPVLIRIPMHVDFNFD